MNVEYNVIKGLILEHGAKFIVNCQETDLRLDGDLIEFRLLVLGGYYGVTPETEITFCPETAEFVWREGDEEGYEELRAKPYLLLDKEMAEALSDLHKAVAEADADLKTQPRIAITKMRTRPIPKEVETITGTKAVDITATMAMLEASCPEDQEHDAYWQAVDLLDENEDLSFTELCATVTADHGFLNRGYVLESGAGRAYWDRKDKELCIRWALADHIRYRSGKQRYDE